MSYEEEIWKSIPSLPGYLVSNLGRVRSPRKHHPLQGHIDQYGYREFCVGKAGSGRTNKKCHRLVAEAFLGLAPFERALVRHLNGDPSDNRPSNLAWGTDADNQADKARHGSLRGSRNGKSFLTEKQVLALRRMATTGAWSRKCLADAFGLTESGVQNIVKRRTWKWLNDDGSHRWGDQ